MKADVVTSTNASSYFTETRMCSVCKVTKSTVEEFSKSQRGKGSAAKCKDCIASMQGKTEWNGLPISVCQVEEPSQGVPQKLHKITHRSRLSRKQCRKRAPKRNLEVTRAGKSR